MVSIFFAEIAWFLEKMTLKGLSFYEKQTQALTSFTLMVSPVSFILLIMSQGIPMPKLFGFPIVGKFLFPVMKQFLGKGND